MTCPAMSLATVFELGVVGKLNQVLSYAFQNSVESFFEPCLEICLWLLQSTKTKEDKAAVAMLLKNVELYCVLAATAEACDTAAHCLMLAVQLSEGDNHVAERLLSNQSRGHLRTCLTDHSLKGDSTDIQVVSCVLHVLQGITKTGNEQLLTILKQDEILLSCLREVVSPRSAGNGGGGSSPPAVTDGQKLAKSLVEVICGKPPGGEP
eukprot:TRINITY_DN8668_c1_g2_i1.p1 TRINITY_DN8668_c1_g2~~TRINITY_DN8668_c1_g2_i1.p1  ORF type:complete len:208 (+),score=57.17 TRINITY_DN8668_c1_g2_i1:133-756(+)